MKYDKDGRLIIQRDIIDNSTAKTVKLGISLDNNWSIIDGDIALQKYEVNLANKIFNRITCKIGALKYNYDYGCVLQYMKYRFRSGIDESLISSIIRDCILSDQSVDRIVNLNLYYDDNSFTFLVVEASLVVNGNLNINISNKVPLGVF